MPMSNCTIVFIHGGCRMNLALLLIAALNTHAYPTVTRPLPTVSNSTPKSADLSTNVEYVRSRLLALLLDEGKEIIITMHSYGGVVRNSVVQVDVNGAGARRQKRRRIRTGIHSNIDPFG